jgi:hypothetical protein
LPAKIEAAHLGEPFKQGALLVMHVLELAAQVSIGTLYILDDCSDVAIERLQGESPDLWIVDRFSGNGGSRRCGNGRWCTATRGVRFYLRQGPQSSTRPQCRLFDCGARTRPLHGL